MRCILLLVSDVAASIDGNATSYNGSSVELFQEGDATEDVVNVSVTQSPEVPTLQHPETDGPGHGFSTEPLPLSGPLPTAVQEGEPCSPVH